MFVIASLKLDEAACDQLKQTFFGAVKSKELKHTALSGRPKQQQMVLDFMTHLRDNPGVVKLAAAHKRFALVCKSVDLLVETAAHEDGIDVYDQGFNLALANIVYWTMPVFGGEAFFSEFLRRLQIMIRKRTPEAYASFCRMVFTQYANPGLNELLSWYRVSLYRLGSSFLFTLPEDTLDLGFTLALVNMAEWRAETSEELYLVHDRSSAMAKQAHIWETFVDPNLPPAEVGYDRRKMKFPIAIERTDFEPSENHAGLQLADVAAGAMARYARWLAKHQEEPDGYAMELSKIVEELPVFQCGLR